MNVGELLAGLDAAGVIRIDGSGEREINDALDERGVDPEAPIPVWNAAAEAWEV